MLTHVILGMGRELLRAHNSTTYLWNHVNCVWKKYEGLLPEEIYTFLKEFLIVLECLFRMFVGEVKCDEVHVLKAVEDVFRRFGGDVGLDGVWRGSAVPSCRQWVVKQPSVESQIDTPKLCRGSVGQFRTR